MSLQISTFHHLILTLSLFGWWQDQVSFGSFISAIFSRCTFLFMFFWCYILQNVFRQCIKFASILSLSKENVHLELPVEFLVFMYTECCAPAFEHILYTFRFEETTFSHLSPGFYVNMFGYVFYKKLWLKICWIS